MAARYNKFIAVSFGPRLCSDLKFPECNFPNFALNFTPASSNFKRTFFSTAVSKKSFWRDLNLKCFFHWNSDLLNVVVHVVELSVEPLEAHDLVGDLLRQGSNRRVLDIAKQVLDANLLSFFGSNFGL